MNRRVKGALFVDFVRMIRANKETDWSRYLPPEDLEYLSSRVDPSAWYPMEIYERLGLAILEVIVGNRLELVRQWGRETTDLLHRAQPELFVANDARETFMRFESLRASLFDFAGVRVRTIRDGEVRLEVDYGMSARAEEAATHQSVGFLERLVELSGGTEIEATIPQKSWAGDAATIIALRWSQAPLC